MAEVFIKILNMSLTACWIILAAILFRILLKNSPKNIRFVLWALVGIRLVCPISFESMLSVIPTAEPISPTIIQPTTEVLPVIIPGTVIQQAPVVSVEPIISTTQVVLNVLSTVWILGIAVMTAYSVISYLKIKAQIKISLKLKDNIYLCDNISSPFILGMIIPKIFLPSNLTESEKDSVIAHEIAHLKRYDHIWKPLGFAILTVYWFNPLIWVAYVLLCRDIELACDEKVIKKMDVSEKKKYSEALLSCSISRKAISACPLAFGEVDVKNRVKSIINYKRPMFWVIIVSVAVCIAVGIFFATNPKKEDSPNVPDDEECIGNLVDEPYFTLKFLDMYGNENHRKPVLLLNNEQNTFSLSYPLLSSVGVSGTFTRGELKLICTSYDGKYKYVFIVMNNGYNFSREVPFKHPQYSESSGMEPLYDGDHFESEIRIYEDEYSSDFYSKLSITNEGTRFKLEVNGLLYYGSCLESDSTLTCYDERNYYQFVFDYIRGDFSEGVYVFNKKFSRENTSLKDCQEFSKRLNYNDMLNIMSDSQRVYYVMDGSYVKKSIFLSENGYFRFSPKSAVVDIFGTYEESKDKVVLNTFDGRVYIFKKDRTGLTFETDGSFVAPSLRDGEKFLIHN